MMYDKRIGLDFETYSACDLKTHGLERYVSDPSFKVLIGSTAKRDIEYNVIETDTIDFTLDMDDAKVRLLAQLNGMMICAHNADFERRVLKEIGIDMPADRFIDSAVLSSAVGAGRHLNEAAPQLLGVDKMADGIRLIRLFSVPTKYQEENESPWFDRRVVDDNPTDWNLFAQYCELDAELSLRLVVELARYMPAIEDFNACITQDMNREGWFVDLELVKEMQRRYEENVAQAEAVFRRNYKITSPTFFGSHKQQKEWCQARGVKCTSFDEKHVAKYLALLDKKIGEAYNKPVIPEKHNNYIAVRDLMATKQILGGSSLKKLQTILDTVGADGRLRDQYFHIGAGQSWRTTGRGVQMQNLKRLNEPADMEDLMVGALDPENYIEWSNAKLAENLRQVFCAEHPHGQLIVGDFKSVEMVGLAWLAGETWKVDAFRAGKDLYKVGAAKQYGVAYESVNKTQRMFGKVGELSCGYQAGDGAVKDFAAGMGIELTEGEASKVVSDFRAANPFIVKLWYDVDKMLREVVLGGARTRDLYVGADSSYRLSITAVPTPKSLLDQHPGAQSVAMELVRPEGGVIVRRFFHGVYERGGGMCYYKPSTLKGGPLWTNTYTNPKTKRVEHNNLYGGKVVGILTQSLCRELFFACLRKLSRWVDNFVNVRIVGQFHDEIVVEWRPRFMADTAGQPGLDETIQVLAGVMSDPGDILGFPLEADVKHAYRYIK